MPSSPAPSVAASERPAYSSAADALVSGHLPLARSLARRFANRGETLDDLIQVAMVGLVKAAIRFDTRHHTQFSTYATATISGELKRHFRDKRWGLHVTRSAQERYLLVRDATEWATQDLGRAPTVAEIASRARVSDEEVLEAQELASVFHLETLDAPAPGGDPSGARRQLGRPDPGLGAVDDRLVLHGLLEGLPERERAIVHLRFVEELTQSEIAAHLGLSQMQVSRILARTLASMRASLAP
jgi:RNA polymerase sigma-B factor